MNPERKARLQKMVFVLNGSLFLLGSYDLLGQGKLLFAVLQALAAALNFIMLLSIARQRYSKTMSTLLLLMNVLVALSIAFDYHFHQGKEYIQYAWVLAALISVLALVLKLKKEK